MYDKKVVGTPEAFSGYEDVANKAGWVCESADEFVAATGLAQETITLGFDWKLRVVYMLEHSFEAARKRFQDILRSRRHYSMFSLRGINILSVIG